MNYNDPRFSGAASQAAQGFVTGVAGGVPWQDGPPKAAVGLDLAGQTIERLKGQLIEICNTLERKHGMIHGPVPQGVSDGKIGGGSGLLYELNRLAEAAELIGALANSL